MQNKPLISIIIPVYNRQELVKETLDSVLDQTYQSWECIVVDDGSTDDTWEVLEAYAKKNTRIKIHKRHRAPKGAPTCRNIGADIANGQYLMFLDSDDLLISECLEYRIQKIEKNPYHSAWMFETGVFNMEIGDSKFLWNILNTEVDDVVRFLNQDMPWHTSGPIWLNENLLRFNEEALSFQDWEYHLRFLTQSESYYKDTEGKVLSYYRRDENKSHFTISSQGLKKLQMFNRIEVIIKTSFFIKEKFNKYDNDILKLIYRNTKFLKEQGFRKESIKFFRQAKQKLNLNSFDANVLLLYLFFINDTNLRYLEFLIYRVLKKGYLFEKRSTFMYKETI